MLVPNLKVVCGCNVSGTCWVSSSRNGSLLLIYLTGMILRKEFSSVSAPIQFGRVEGWLICRIFNRKNVCGCNYLDATKQSYIGTCFTTHLDILVDMCKVCEY